MRIVVEGRHDEAQVVEFLHEAVDEAHSFSLREVSFSVPARPWRRDTAVSVALQMITTNQLLSLEVWGVPGAGGALRSPRPPSYFLSDHSKCIPVK